MAESTTQVSEFRRWVQEQKPILNSLDTDEFLFRFLRVTGFDLTEAKGHLIRFWKYRSENPQWFTNRDLINNPSMVEISHIVYCLQLPKPTKDNQTIFLMRIGQYDPTKYTFDAVTKYAFAVTDVLNSQPAAQTNGFIILLDFSQVKLQHVNQFTPDYTRRYVSCWEKMYPVNLHQIHFFNYPSLFDPVLHLFRMFLSRKLSDKLIFHGKSSDNASKNSLHHHIDPAILPQEYGGQLESIEKLNQTFVQWTRENQEKMTQLDGFGVDLKQVSELFKKVQKEN
ncbi:unnamed protein product [Adineta ricciae]|uniref:CRAL-TRIO domain-containing protein n=1 Tax=Adineta ricciae TaxID=249248 RepID=A0A815Z797_ADIRI|nr:unnamed protein product [Adineta ricciae]